ncbi:MAG: hypothetical protein C0408_02445, partial [Odoribacter sp.]|nr:hypothetical protein [Odoribacter sp.]
MVVVKMKIKLLLSLLLSLYFHAEPVEASLLSSRVRVRLFTEFSPDHAIFTVSSGTYKITNGSGISIYARSDEPVIIARFNDKVFVKERNGK